MKGFEENIYEASCFNIRNLSVYGLRGIGIALGMAFTFIASRILPLETAGALFLWIAWARAGFTFSIFGHDQHLVRLLPKKKATNSNSCICAAVQKSLKESLKNSIIITSVIILGTSLLAISRKSNESEFLICIIILISIIPLTLATIFAESLRGINKFLESILITPITNSAIPAFLILPATYWFGAAGAAFSFSLGAIFSFLLGLILWNHHKPKAFKDEKTDIENSKEIRNLGFLSIISMSQGWFETVLAAFLLSEQEIAHYTVAVTFASIIQFGLSSQNILAAPRLSFLVAKKNISYLNKFFNATRKASIVIAFGPAILILGFPDKLLGFVGLDYTSAAGTLQILVLGQIINAFSGPVGPTLLAFNNEKFLMRTLFITAILNIIGIYALAPSMGILGVASASASSLAITNLACLMRVKYLCKKKISFYNEANLY